MGWGWAEARWLRYPRLAGLTPWTPPGLSVHTKDPSVDGSFFLGAETSALFDLVSESIEVFRQQRFVELDGKFRLFDPNNLSERFDVFHGDEEFVANLG